MSRLIATSLASAFLALAAACSMDGAQTPATAAFSTCPTASGGTAGAASTAGAFRAAGPVGAYDELSRDRRGAQPTPVAALTPHDVERFLPVPIRERAIPVVVFHQICTVACGPADTYGITRDEFARILLGAQAAGYATISIADYVRALQGDWTGLPARPLLVTFDDGRLDGYRGADDILRQLGERAVMYVITGNAGRAQNYAMQWPEIAAAEASGRWDIQLHAHQGHVLVPIDAPDAGAGDASDAGSAVAPVGAFYACRCYEPATPLLDAHLESFLEWKARAEDDILTGSSLLVTHLGDRPDRAVSFAVPYSDYGQRHSNDAAIAPEMRSFLDAHFAVWFTQPSADPDFTTSLTPTHEAGRYLVLSSTTAETVYAWLAKHATVMPKR